MRRVERPLTGAWDRAVTPGLAPLILRRHDRLALDSQRGRLTAACPLLNRLVGVADFRVGSPNGVQLHRWATGVLVAVWVDRTDAVAEALTRPCRHLAIAMVFRGGSHFPQACQRGDAADPVADWTAKAKELAISTRHPARAAPAPVPT